VAVVVAGFFVVVPVLELERALTEETQAQATTAQTAVNAALRILVQALNAKPLLQQKMKSPNGLAL
jgi:hypothetical protein